MDIIMELLILIGVGTALITLITEIAKAIGLVEKNLFVLILSEVIAFVGYFAYIDIKSITHEWYYLAAVFVLGFCLAFSSMFGYDKFKQFVLQWKDKVSKNEEEK